MQRHLFKLSKQNKILHYVVMVETNPSDSRLITEKGQFLGAYQSDTKLYTKGKNIGKANETTHSQQAFSEAESKINKQKDDGYKEWEGELNPSPSIATDVLNWLKEQGKGTDASGELKPMLAHKDLKSISFPCLIQRKYDGIRCFSKVNGGTSMKSRNGKEFTYLGHIMEDLAKNFHNCIVDGELYSDTLTFQEILSSVKREQPSNKEISLRIYDVIPLDNLTLKQSERVNLLTLKTESSCLHPVETYLVNNLDEVKEYFARFIEEGYEGAILRNLDGEYEFGGRSRDLIKYKEFDDDEFEIVDVIEAQGRDEGTAIFIMTNKMDQQFKARPVGSRELRREYLLNKKEMIGKVGTVQYQGLTDDGVPRFPVFKCVRDYE